MSAANLHWPPLSYRTDSQLSLSATQQQRTWIRTLRFDTLDADGLDCHVHRLETHHAG
jgi:hypothetical protein